MLTRWAWACLTMFVSASWTNPVEDGLGFARKAALGKPGLELRLDAGLLGEGRRQPIERGDETEVVERLGAQLHGKAPDVLERDRDELAKLGERGVEAVASPASPRST